MIYFFSNKELRIILNSNVLDNKQNSAWSIFRRQHRQQKQQQQLFCCNSNLVVPVVCHFVTPRVAPVLPVVIVVSVVVKRDFSGQGCFLGFRVWICFLRLGMSRFGRMPAFARIESWTCGPLFSHVLHGPLAFCRNFSPSVQLSFTVMNDEPSSQ